MARQNWQQIGAFRGMIHPSVDSPSVLKSLAGISELLSSDSAVLLQAGRHRTIRLPSFGEPLSPGANEPSSLGAFEPSSPGAFEPLSPDAQPPRCSIAQPPRCSIAQPLNCSTAQSLDVVVKAFGKQSFFKDLWDRFFGSKAFRTYRTAAFLTEAGIGTVHPVAVLERWSGSILKESYFVSLYMADTVCFKDRLVDLFKRDAEYGEFTRLFNIVADGVRALHDSGCAHGDLGNQNIEIQNLDSDKESPRCVFLDLNRASCGSPLSQCARAHDLVRIWLPPACRKEFLHRYWNGDPPWLFSVSFSFWHALFRFHSVTRSVRHPFREYKYRSHPELAPQSADYPRGEALKEWQRRVFGEKTNCGMQDEAGN